MKPNRLTKLLSLLETPAKIRVQARQKKNAINEIRDFAKWLQSPWANSNSRIIELYEAIIVFYPNFKSDGLTKEYLFQKIYHNKPFNDRMIRNLMGDLAKQLDSYFIHTSLMNKPKARKELLIDTYYKRGHTSQANKLSQEELEIYKTPIAKNADDYLRAFYLEKQLLQQPSMRTKVLGKKDLLLELEKNLDSFYAIQKIKILADQKDRQNFVKETIFNREQELDYLSNLTSNKVNALVSIYRIFQDNALDAYQKYKSAIVAFEKEMNSLSLEDQKLILARLQNILINIDSKGGKNVTKEIFNLYCFWHPN